MTKTPLINGCKNGLRNGQRGVDEKCMVWLEKGSKNRMSDNLYFWFSSAATPKRKKNVRVKLFMFEWFVGPSQLTEKEREVYAIKKKGTKGRVRPRQLRNRCGNRFCINPFHLYCIPELPKDILLEQTRITKKRKYKQKLPCEENGVNHNHNHDDDNDFRKPFYECTKKIRNEKVKESNMLRQAERNTLYLFQKVFPHKYET
jgi:hypothetical protein